VQTPVHTWRSKIGALQAGSNPYAPSYVTWLSRFRSTTLVDSPPRGDSEPSRIAQWHPDEAGARSRRVPAGDVGRGRQGGRRTLCAQRRERSAGSVIRRQLAPYFNMQRFIIERWPSAIRGTGELRVLRPG
jgi:hypothetical protein